MTAGAQPAERRANSAEGAGTLPREGTVAMVMKTYYDDGYFDYFDTTQLVDPSPLRGNRLTNWSLDLDVEDDGPILLSMYWYDSTGDEPDPAGLPIAYRHDGWSFVVADAEDRKHLLRMTVDGDPALVRAGDDLVDCNRLDYVADFADHVVPRALRAMEFLEAMGSNLYNRGKQDERATTIETNIRGFE